MPGKKKLSSRNGLQALRFPNWHRIVNRPEIHEDPHFLLFLPTLCAAWADGLLAEKELRAFHRVLGDAEWMPPESRVRVAAWLAPHEPPTPSVYGQAVERVRSLNVRQGTTLARAGLDLASNVAPEDGSWSSPSTMATLGKLESELGMAGPEALRDILSVDPVGSDPDGDAGGEVPEDLVSALRGVYPETRARVREVLRDPVFDIPLDLDRSSQRERTLDAVTALAKAGIGSLAYPKDFGGENDPGAAVAAFDELALGDLSVLIKFGVQFGLFGGSVAQLGTDRHHDRYLARIGSLELPGCYAMTETGHGSNVRDIETTATFDSEDPSFIVHTPTPGAQKDYIGNAACHGQMATVFAQLIVNEENHGVHALLVPIRDADGKPLPGVEIEDCGGKEGLNGVDNGRLRFNQVRVGHDALLDRFAQVTADGKYESDIPSSGKRFFTMLGTLVAGRISIGAASNTVSKKALAIAIPYTDQRRQFGPSGGAEVPVLDYLSVQRNLLTRLSKTIVLGWSMDDLTTRFGRDEDRRELEVLAAGMKSVASWHALDTLQICREACGGKGYLAENQFGRLKADTDVFATFEGANAVLLQLVAKGLLSQYGREMGDLRMWGMLQYLTDLAGTALSEMNPVATRRTDRDHLTDSEFQQAAFQYREKRLLRSVARRLKSRIDDGMDSFHAMNECQDHLITLALAHVDAVLLKNAQAAVDEVPEGSTKALLKDVVHLFALSTLEAESAWYLETNYFEGAKSRAIRSEVNRLCAALRPHATTLVRAWEIPQSLLKAPIAN